jgi:predicted kinase
LNRARLFILSGPPFAGKSTLARAMEARFGLVRIEIDEVLRRRNLDFGKDDAWRIAFQHSFRRLHRELGAGASVIWDSASLTRVQRLRIRATGERYGAAVHLIYVATGDEERERRRFANQRVREREDIPRDAFDEAGAAFEPPSDEERPIRFDASQPIGIWLEMTIAPLMNAAETE